MHKQSHAGFTLIEVMIAVAIVGILSAITIPAYQNYLIRAQVSEGLSMAGSWKAAIVEYYASNGSWPSQADLPDNSQSGGMYASNFSVNTGVIQIVYGGPQANPAINGAILTLVPYTNDNNDIIWRCGLAAAPAGTIAAGATPGGTTLAPQQLPSSCNT
jgi:type IV pilus assembly protein PilA